MTNKALSFGYKVGGKNMSGWEREDSMTRREFITACGALATGALYGGDELPQTVAAEAPRERDPFLGTGGAPLKVGSPCLQAPGETTMGVSWA